MAYWVDYGFSFVKSDAQFRVPLALQMVFALATIALVLVLPESPRWLLKKGRDEQARAVLDQLSMHTDDVQRDAAVLMEYNEIKTALAEEEANGLITKDGKKMSGMRACFTNGKERYAHTFSPLAFELTTWTCQVLPPCDARCRFAIHAAALWN